MWHICVFTNKGYRMVQFESWTPAEQPNLARDTLVITKA